jgi:hypothetical protein
MKTKHIAISLCAAGIFFCGEAKADSTPSLLEVANAHSDTWLPLSESEVYDIIKQIPAECSLYHYKLYYCHGGPGGYEKGKDAHEIARVVARHARSKYEAVQMVVYSSYESNNNLHAEGDTMRQHHSYGAWEIPIPNLSADRQLEYWMYIRDRSLKYCSSNPPESRMAGLASGACNRAIRKVEKREAVIATLSN